MKFPVCHCHCPLVSCISIVVNIPLLWKKWLMYPLGDIWSKCPCDDQNAQENMHAKAFRIPPLYYVVTLVHKNWVKHQILQLLSCDSSRQTCPSLDNCSEPHFYKEYHSYALEKPPIRASLLLDGAVIKQTTSTTHVSGCTCREPITNKPVPLELHASAQTLEPLFMSLDGHCLDTQPHSDIQSFILWRATKCERSVRDVTSKISKTIIQYNRYYVKSLNMYKTGFHQAIYITLSFIEENLLL